MGCLLIMGVHKWVDGGETVPIARIVCCDIFACSLRRINKGFVLYKWEEPRR